MLLGGIFQKISLSEYKKTGNNLGTLHLRPFKFPSTEKRIENLVTYNRNVFVEYDKDVVDYYQ